MAATATAIAVVAGLAAAPRLVSLVQAGSGQTRAVTNLQSAAGQMRTAINLLMRIAESGKLSDEDLRLLDTAMLRLRFAAERLERE